MLGITDEEIKASNRKRKVVAVRFHEDEEIINPEDVDPTIGKFRNLIQTAVIPNKKVKLDASNPFGSGLADSAHPSNSQVYSTSYSNDYSRASVDSTSHNHVMPLFSASLSAKLGLHLPNPAPDVDLLPPVEMPAINANLPHQRTITNTNVPPEPKKKKYAKEAWPGKKPAPSLLV